MQKREEIKIVIKVPPPYKTRKVSDFKYIIKHHRTNGYQFQNWDKKQQKTRYIYSNKDIRKVLDFRNKWLLCNDIKNWNKVLKEGFNLMLVTTRPKKLKKFNVSECLDSNEIKWLETEVSEGCFHGPKNEAQTVWNALRTRNEYLDIQKVIIKRIQDKIEKYNVKKETEQF